MSCYDIPGYDSWKTQYPPEWDEDDPEEESEEKEDE